MRKAVGRLESLIVARDDQLRVVLVEAIHVAFDTAIRLRSYTDAVHVVVGREICLSQEALLD